MKYQGLKTKLSPKPVVVVAGNFNPPSNHHQMLIRGAQKVAESLGTTYTVYLCPGGLLSESKQEAYFTAAFPNVPYKRVESSPFDTDTDIYVVGESLRVYQLSESVEILRITGQLRIEAASGNYYSFKSHLPLGMRDVDSRSLFNDLREALGYDRVDFTRKQNPLRESFVRGEAYRVGETVVSEGKELVIARRGANYLVCTDPDGRVVQKWLHEVTAVGTDQFAK